MDEQIVKAWKLCLIIAAVCIAVGFLVWVARWFV